MTKTIPFDYAFEFALAGQRGNKVQDVVEISVEGVFVTTAVGYSLVLDESRTSRFVEPRIDSGTVPPPPVALPHFENVINGSGGLTGVIASAMPGSEVAVLNPPLDESGQPNLLASGSVAANGIVDLELSGLDPVALLQIWDRSNNLMSQPFQAGDPTTPVIGPDPDTMKLPAVGAQPGPAEEIQPDRVFVYGSVPDQFDFFLLDASGGIQPIVDSPFTLAEAETFGRRTFRAEVPLRIDPAQAGAAQGREPQPVRLTGGETLLVRAASSDLLYRTITYAPPRPRPSTITLGALAGGLEQINADLSAGFRLNRQLANRFAADIPFDQINPDVRSKIFQTGCAAAQEVSFLYTIDVISTGRELQNKAIHNIAGLGIGNGDRPFRPLAQPFAIEPRSSVRILIEELSGPPGTLYIVLHGYKTLGTARIPT